MLISKEMNGGIYLAQIGKTEGADHAGFIPTWYFIGPGLRPTVVPYGDDTYLLLFDYLGVLNGRVVNAKPWPPEQVDPVTTTPFVSVQRGEDAVAFTPQGSMGFAWKQADWMLPANGLFRSDDLIYEEATDTYTTRVSRDITYNPDPHTLRGWRLYSRNIGDTEWDLLSDWVDEILNIPVTGSPKIKKEYRITWGHLIDPDRPNDPWARLESAPGPILTLDSDKISKTLRQQYTDALRGRESEGDNTSSYVCMSDHSDILLCQPYDQCHVTLHNTDGQHTNALGGSLSGGYFMGHPEGTEYDGEDRDNGRGQFKYFTVSSVVRTCPERVEGSCSSCFGMLDRSVGAIV